MSDEHPKSAIEATGKVASDIVGGLKNQPALLAMIVLNITGILAALYVLAKINESSSARFDAMIELCSKLSTHLEQRLSDVIIVRSSKEDRSMPQFAKVDKRTGKIAEVSPSKPQLRQEDQQQYEVKQVGDDAKVGDNASDHAESGSQR